MAIKEGDPVYIAKNIFSILRAKLQIHFRLDQFHNQDNLDDLIHLVDTIEEKFNDPQRTVVEVITTTLDRLVS